MNKYSEQELLSLSQEQILLLNNADKNKSIRDQMFDMLPCWVHLNRLNDHGLIYMNKTGLDNFNKSMDEINKEGGIKFLQKIIHPDTAKQVIPLIYKFIAEDNESKVISFEQKIKYVGTNNYKNHISFSMLKKKLNATITVTLHVNQLENFIKKKLFPGNNVFQKYYNGFITLSKREKEILKLISLGKTNKQIGELLLISTLTVKTHRRNIINKLRTNKTSELTRIAIYFNLIDN